MKQLSLVTHVHLQKISQFQHLCLFVCEGSLSINVSHQVEPKNFQWEKVLGLILDKLDSKQILGQNGSFPQIGVNIKNI